ncbi:ABC transporter substrate-binding protein [Frondihabitans australicus]|uniref:Alpha-glucoside transport system substrate-binding protein n=1 Tax=Frondihabitans australicus TaxID=386892 RepID=A0A495II00_9MICO|nr:ABC transporter substrate-binding protein [Frondihabitans australicus]RKR75330.1 alpha-glucoside transport system substrate-binding protein [Frondihabitans australicus]
MKLSRKITAAIAVAAGAAIALSGCSGSSGGNSGSTTVTISGAFTGAQATAFQADVSAWAKTQGLTVKYNGSNSFQTGIVTQVKGGQAPDVAIFPQPGVLKSLISNNMVPLDDLINVKSVTSDEAQGIPDIAKVNGKTYGLPYSINVKSLVWYDPAAFKAAGYTVPTTDAELMALQNKIISSGSGYPWCVGIASQGSNGWPMTDWLEEYVLRYGGLTQYNDWITHKVKFDSPLVKKAAAKVESMIFANGAVDGGGKAMASTDFGAAGNNLFITGGKAKGQCFMMRQGTFITGFFPKDIQAQIAKNDTTNVNAFTLPTPSDATTSGTLGGGDLVAAFHNTPAVKKVVNYLVGKEFGTHGYAKQWTAYLSAHNTFPEAQYASPFQKVAQNAVKQSKVFGFDASDQMPGAVGAGTEWTNLTQWTAGQESLDDALKAIDASWPATN